MVSYNNGVLLVICVINLSSICSSYHLLPHSNISLIRSRRQSGCRPNQFRCNDGSCLERYKVCDGKKHCADWEDEYNNCNPEPCPDFTFKCAYGACVDGDARCNQQQECRDGSDEAGCESNTPAPTNNVCGNSFACKNGNGCVPKYKVCDGIKDCSDSSDDSFAECKDVRCPEHTFRCTYGACIDAELRCNGSPDCADNSDEDPARCETTTQKPTPVTPPISLDFCPRPNIENGHFTVLGQGYVPGAPIPNFAVVNMSCNNHYALYPNNPIVYCINGQFSIKIPECRTTCDPRISSSVDVKCTIDGITVDCTKPLVEGTIAEGQCKNYYTQPNLAEFPDSKCSGGSWDRPLIYCVPDCGEVIPDGQTNIINGHDAKRGEFPWHVGLYRLQNSKYEYQCGGSIITRQLVITAAHCFTDVTAKKYPAYEYFIAAGKYYSDYDSELDVLAEKRQVREYHIPNIYRGYSSNYAGDIAVAIVQAPFQLSNVIQPVCIEWGYTIEPQQLKPNNRGTVVGWGYVDPTKHKASEELKQLTAPYIDAGQCLDVVPKNFQRWVTTDKFCAGFTNGSSVCRGDSGGGMVFPWNVGNKQKYYLRGLVSVGPVQKGNCDSFQYGVYTKISAHNNFIREIIANYPSD